MTQSKQLFHKDWLEEFAMTVKKKENLQKKRKKL